MPTTAKSPIPAWELHHRLGRALEHAGLTVHEMRDHLGVSDSTMSNYLAGRTKPKAGLLRLWAIRCGLPYHWLATGAESTPDDPDGQDGPLTIWYPKVIEHPTFKRATAA